MGYKVENWVTKLLTLLDIASTHPHAVYSAFFTNGPRLGGLGIGICSLKICVKTSVKPYLVARFKLLHITEATQEHVEARNYTA